jgi:Zn-dependent protease with chaperone function
MPFLLSLIPVLLGAGAGGFGSRAARRLPPALATVLLTAFALTVALATGMLLCLAAYVGTVGLLPLVHPRDWSPRRLHEELPIPAWVALATGAVAGVLLARACRHLVRVVRSSRRTAAAAAALPAIGDLAVVPDTAIHAYAVPGGGPHRRGRVVVSTGMLRCLSGPQRRALLAHEQAHLRYHHHWYVQLARLAAAANPLMRPVAIAVDQATERWADAVAVRQVGDRAVVAHALGRAALARPAAPGDALGAAQHDVLDRIRDLLEPPRRQAHTALLFAAATAACWLCTIAVILYTHGIVDIAEAASR